MKYGYRAVQRDKNMEKCYICSECSSNINTRNLEEYKSKFSDDYCVNCWESMEGGGNVEINMKKEQLKNWKTSVNERLCCLIDLVFSDIHPMLSLAPGEEPEQEKIGPVTHSKHPNDAIEQVVIMYTNEEQEKRIENFLDSLSSKGKLEYRKDTEYQHFIAIISLN